MERMVFECLVLKDYKLQTYKWFLEPDYAPGVVTRTKYINFENVVEFVLMGQRDPFVHSKSLGKTCQFQFIMDGFLFENKFCQHFKYENAQVFVSFHIHQFNDQITISHCYNDKLDVENKRVD